MQEEKGTDPSWFIIGVLAFVRFMGHLSDEEEDQNGVTLLEGQNGAPKDAGRGPLGL